jgi:hypothetical protein
MHNPRFLHASGDVEKGWIADDQSAMFTPSNSQFQSRHASRRFLAARSAAQVHPWLD